VTLLARVEHGIQRGAALSAYLSSFCAAARIPLLSILSTALLELSSLLAWQRFVEPNSIVIMSLVGC